MKFFQNFDYSIFFSILLIGILGLSAQWSLVPDLFIQQLINFTVGVLIFLLISQIDFRIYFNPRNLIYMFSLILLVATSLFGEASRGAVRWLWLGSFSLQTSEIVKPLLIAFFSLYFSQEKFVKIKIIVGLFLFSIPLLLIFKQPDLGSSLILAVSFLGILIAFGIPKIFYLFGGIMTVFFVPVFWLILADYQKERILSFINPYSDPLGSGYNLIQSVLSVGSGQLLGKGLGKGTQSHLLFLPEKHTDFVFASYVEETGFIGAVLLLCLYLFLLFKILKTGEKSRYLFGRLFCFGVFFMMFFQIFVNVGMNLGIMPITGITLPLFSYGGSSILALMVTLGMIESLAGSEKKDNYVEIR